MVGGDCEVGMMVCWLALGGDSSCCSCYVVLVVVATDKHLQWPGYDCHSITDSKQFSVFASTCTCVVNLTTIILF